MNQSLPQLAYFVKAFTKGLLAGSLASLAVYGSIRLLFYGFSFTAWEEIRNILSIILTGGLITGVAVIAFLLLERAIIFSRISKLSLSPLLAKKIGAATIFIFSFGFLVKRML
jgi:hypothetical protein